MNPFFFGRSGRQLFGAYDPPAARSSRGLVLCHPWAREYLLAHPTMRSLAQRAAEKDWHVLRFDYYGTGDSAGDLDEASQAIWVDDVVQAVEELKDMAQVRRVALLGMRGGGAVAAMAARRRSDVDQLVLWDPVFDGRAYLAEQGSGGDGGATPRWREDMESISPATYGSGLPETVMLHTGPDPGAFDPLTASLSAANVPWTMEHVPDVQVWREEWGRGGVGLAAKAMARALERLA